MFRRVRVLARLLVPKLNNHDAEWRHELPRCLHPSIHHHTLNLDPTHHRSRDQLPAWPCPRARRPLHISTPLSSSSRHTSSTLQDMAHFQGDVALTCDPAHMFLSPTLSCGRNSWHETRTHWTVAKCQSTVCCKHFWCQQLYRIVGQTRFWAQHKHVSRSNCTL